MIKKFISIYGLLAILILGSCNSTIYFTQDMRNSLTANDLRIEDVQFYTSKKLILKRNLSFDETKIARGEIKFENGQYVEEIIIPKNTPGVAVDYNSRRIDVSFEQGYNRDLSFALNGEELYQITALDWENDYGKIKYDTLVYFMKPGGDEALLKVKNDNIYNYQRNKRVLKGRTITK